MVAGPWRKATTHVKAAGCLGRGATQQAFDDSTSDSRVSPPTNVPVPFPLLSPTSPGENASYFNGHPQAPHPWAYSQFNTFAHSHNSQMLPQVSIAHQPQMNHHGQLVIPQQPFTAQQPSIANQPSIIDQGLTNQQPLSTQQSSISGSTYTLGFSTNFGPSQQQYNASAPLQQSQITSPAPFNSPLQGSGCDNPSSDSLLSDANNNRSYSFDYQSPLPLPRSYTAPSLPSRGTSFCDHDPRSFNIYTQSCSECNTTAPTRVWTDQSNMDW